MKDLRQASHILGIKLVRDRQKRMLGLSQVTYIDIVPARISMHNSKKGFVPLRLGKILSSYQRHKTHAEIDIMRRVLNAYAMESIIDAMLSSRLDICFAWSVDSR